MLGNFSFGDYFKSAIIPWSWEFVTEDLGFDGDRLWITVHESDDEAEAIWHEQVGVPMVASNASATRTTSGRWARPDRAGRAARSNIDRGSAFGPDGGPSGDPQGDRFMEFWNLVFMQYNQAPDARAPPLPKPSIDTGAGLERMLCLLQGVDSGGRPTCWQPLIDQACSLTGKKYTAGDYDDRASFSIARPRRARPQLDDARQRRRVPSNEGRGYVLRRIIRRAVTPRLPAGHRAAGHARSRRHGDRDHGGAYPQSGPTATSSSACSPREEERFPPDAEDRAGHPRGRAVDRRGRAQRLHAFLLHEPTASPWS